MSQLRLPTPAGLGDINDTHTYPEPTTEPSDPTRALACGEFGGVSVRVPGHVWEGGNFGYGVVLHDGWHLTQRYQELMKQGYALRQTTGASAVVYTQIVDVERETNGLLTYDRAVMKPLPNIIAAANRGQFPALPPAPVSHDLVPTSQDTPQTWAYTTAKPADTWTAPTFDASAWTSGPAPFGQGLGNIRTPWTTGDIWLRRTVTLPQDIPAKLSVLARHDEDVEVSINGVLVASASGYTDGYAALPLTDAGRAALTPGGTVVLAVHCHQTNGGQVVDVGIGVDPNAPPAPTHAAWKAEGSRVAWKSSAAGSLWRDNAALTATRWDGNDDVVLVMQNSANIPLSVNLNLGGKRITPTLAPHSWNTFTLAAR